MSHEGGKSTPEQEAAIRERGVLPSVRADPDGRSFDPKNITAYAYRQAALDRFDLLVALDATRAENVRLTVALNGFIWLGNNLHNIALAPATFRELYEAALVDANKALERSP